MDMKLEVVVIGVSDVDRAKAFYEKLGWRLDADFVKGDELRVIQFTPPNSQASIIFGNGVPSPKPGSVQSLTLAVDDIEAARKDLIGRGANVSEVFQYAGGPFNNTGKHLTTPEKTRESVAAIHKVVPTFRLHRSRIRTGTVTCSRRSRRDFPAANGNRRQRGRSTSPRLPSSFTKQSSITATTRRRTENIIGGSGMRLI